MDKLGTKAKVVIILVCLVLFGILCREANSFVQRFFYPRKYADEVSLEAEFVRTVLADETLTEREKRRVIEIGLNALSGEKL